MQVSAEARWFWPGLLPADFERWFCDPLPEGRAASGGKERIDTYFFDAEEVELGIKMRGAPDQVEVKGLIQLSRSLVSFTPNLTGHVELWCKWKTRAVQLSPQAGVPISKTRWLRQFSTDEKPPREISLKETALEGALPGTGCNVELTRIRDDQGVAWWSFGFEAFGELALVEDALKSTIDVMLARTPPHPPPGHNASYPKWLSEIHHGRG